MNADCFNVFNINTYIRMLSFLTRACERLCGSFAERNSVCQGMGEGTEALTLVPNSVPNPLLP